MKTLVVAMAMVWLIAMFHVGVFWLMTQIHDGVWVWVIIVTLAVLDSGLILATYEVND